MVRLGSGSLALVVTVLEAGLLVLGHSVLPRLILALAVGNSLRVCAHSRVAFGLRLNHRGGHCRRARGGRGFRLRFGRGHDDFPCVRHSRVTAVLAAVSLWSDSYR